MNALDLVYVTIDQDIYKGKTQGCSKWKTKKNYLGFLFHKQSNFEAFFLDKKLSANLFFQKSVLELLFVNMMPIMNFH